MNSLTQKEVKTIRAEIQTLVDHLKGFDGGSRERSIVVTKLEEAKMWLGKELGNLGGEDLNAKRDKEDLKNRYEKSSSVSPPPPLYLS